MRADVRDALYTAAAAELEHNGNYVALVSRVLVEQGKTATVEVELQPWTDEAGMVDIILTDVSNQDRDPAMRSDDAL